MTPQQCVEARVRLGWSRQDLAEAAGLAAPIVRMFEAGALAGFDDCEAALAEALMAAEAAPERRDLPCGFVDDGPRPREGARIWPIEARRRGSDARRTTRSAASRRRARPALPGQPPTAGCSSGAGAAGRWAARASPAALLGF